MPPGCDPPPKRTSEVRSGWVGRGGWAMQPTPSHRAAMSGALSILKDAGSGKI